MIAKYVPATRTLLTFEGAAAALRDALTHELKQEPHSTVLALALAKTALETGRWQSMWNFGFGNVKSGPVYDGFFTCIPLNEVINGRTVWFVPEGQLAGRPGTPVVGQRWTLPPGHPQTRMRAYVSAEEGARAYVRFVAASKRYAAAWLALLNGDAVGYVRELKRAGYFTADESQYLRGVVALHKSFINKLCEEATPTYPAQAPHCARPVLRVGSTGSAVCELQRLLGLNETGVFDAVTHVAVAEFQRARMLQIDGIVGPRTWSELLRQEAVPRE